MYFRGDIIITDPCYVMNNENDKARRTQEYMDRVPKLNNFLTILNGNPKDYPDAKKLRPFQMVEPMKGYWKTYKILRRCPDLFKEDIPEVLNFAHEFYSSKIYDTEFMAYKEALKKWDTEGESDWGKCWCGYKLEHLGFKTFMQSTTYYGDWGCTTVNTDTQEKIGQFCADTGQVCVFLLDEVLAYNPNFNYHIERPWTTTLIKDFDGNVEFEVVKPEEDTVHVVGKGNINFKTFQTSM